MTNNAWYLGCSSDDVADRVILVGDPGRVPRLNEHLHDVRHLPVKRGLVTTTGIFAGVPVTLAAYGMGAPIAAIVMHELANLGAHTFIRIGTGIGLAPAEIGDYVIADSAFCLEGTSAAYAPNIEKAAADVDLVNALRKSIGETEHTCRVGSFASFDGFYRDMFALDEGTTTRVSENIQDLIRKNVLAIDMETSAILTVGSVLGCRAASICVSSVNSITHEKLPSDEMISRENILIETALAVLTSTSD